MLVPHNLTIQEDIHDSSKGIVTITLGDNTYTTKYEWGNLAGAWITTTSGEIASTKFVRFLFDKYVNFLLGNKENDYVPLSSSQIDKINSYNRFMDKLVEYHHQKMLSTLDEESHQDVSEDPFSEFYLARAYSVEAMFYAKAKSALSMQGALKTYHALISIPGIIDAQKAPQVESLVYDLHTLGQQFFEKVAHAGKFRVDNTTTKHEINTMYNNHKDILSDLEAHQSDIPFMAFFQEAEEICLDSLPIYTHQLNRLLELHSQSYSEILVE